MSDVIRTSLRERKRSVGKFSLRIFCSNDLIFFLITNHQSHLQLQVERKQKVWSKLSWSLKIHCPVSGCLEKKICAFRSLGLSHDVNFKR